MITSTNYLYDNIVQVQIILDGDEALDRRDKNVFQHPVKVYKGIDNKVRIQFKNNDQKIVPLTFTEGPAIVGTPTGNVVYSAYIPTFNVIDDETGSVVFTIQPTQANVANIANVSYPSVDVVGIPDSGIAVVTISSIDLQPLRKEFYNFSVKLTDPRTGEDYISYSDDNYTARGQMRIYSGHYPEHAKSIDVQIPTLTSPTITSSIVNSNAPNGSEYLHNAQFFFNNFTGNITVQTTLEPSPYSGNSQISNTWSNVAVFNYNAQVNTDLVQFTGLSGSTRFYIQTASGQVTKILYRS